MERGDFCCRCWDKNGKCAHLFLALVIVRGRWRDDIMRKGGPDDLFAGLLIRQGSAG